MKDKKKASSFFSLFKKKSKEPPKQEEVQEPASVTGDSFTAINDLIPSTQLSYKAIEVTSSDSGEVASSRLATIDKIPTVEVVPTPPDDPVPTPPAVVETMIKSQSNSDQAMTSSSSSKRNTFPAPPPPPAPVNKEARRKKKAPPPPQERAVDVIAEPRPKTKTHSETSPKTVDEKMEVIRRELKKETREPVAIRKSSDNSSECSQLVETQILHYSPHNSLRGGNVISPVPGNQEEEPPKVERRSNILLSEEKHKRKSIPVSYYDGRPKQRVAPAPPPPAPPLPTPPPESPREKKRERVQERKSIVLPPSPTIAPPPTPPAHRPKEPSRAGGHVVKPSPARVEASPPATVQTTMMTEQEADLAKRYEDLKGKFEKWQRLQAEGGSATREAKRLQLELIQENESVMAILRSSYPEKAAGSTVNGLATLTKKRPSLSSDTFTPRLSHGLQSPLSIKAPPIFTSGSSVSSASPMTSSPGTSRSVTPKTGSCSSVSPAASIESCDSGMGKAPRIDDSSLKKRVPVVDENSNEVKAKKKPSSATSTEEHRRRAIDRIHEEARDLLRKEQELKKASPAAPINPLAPPPVNNNNNNNIPAKSINSTQINPVERPKVIPVVQGAVIKEAPRPKAPMTSPPAPPLPATAAPVRIAGSRVTQVGEKREEVPRLDRIAPKSPTAKQANGYAIGSVQRSGTTTVVVKKEETVHSTTVRPSMPPTQKTTVTVKKDSAVPVNKIIVPGQSPVVTGPAKMPERVVCASPQQVRKSPVTTAAAASSPAPKLPTLEKRQPDVRTQTSRPFAQQRNEQSSSVTTTVDRIPISYQKRAETAQINPPPPPPPSIPNGFSQKKTVTPVAQSPARPVKLDLSEVVSGGKKTLRKVAPPVERHGITTGKVLESTASTSSSTPGPSSSTSAGGVPAAPPPPPSEFNHSPSSRPTSVPPPPPPPPPPSQLMAGSPIVSTQQLTAQKGRLKPATPNENPGRGPLDLRDCLMEEIRNRGGVALRKVSAN